MDKGLFFQFFATFVGNLMAISDGMAVGWTSPMIPYFLSNETHIHITLHETEWLELWLPIGSIIGVPFTVFFVNLIGRKYSLLLGSTTMLVHWLLLAISPNITLMYVARILAGAAGDMCFVAAPSYISEIADKKIRGFLSSVIFSMHLVGILSIYAIGPYFPYITGPICGISLIVVELILFSFLPESPYYLISKNKREQARKSLLWFRGKKDVECELDEITIAINRQTEVKGKITDIFLRKSYRKSLFIILVLNVAQQIGGFNTIVMNLHIILEEAGSIYIKPATAAVIFSSLMLVAAIASSVIIDKFGRKKLLICSSVLTVFCLLALALYYNFKNLGYPYEHVSWMPAVSVMVYAVIFKIGVGMVPIVITAEIFAARIKAFGMSFGNSVYVITSIGMLKLFGILKEHWGIEYPFYLYAGGLLVTTILTVIFVPETKGKSLDEIQLILEGKVLPKDEKQKEIQQIQY